MTEDRTLTLRHSSGQVTRLAYAAWSRAGADPHGRQKQNQDGYVVREYPGGTNSVLFGVFDGHGSDGAKVSKHLVASLPEFLINSDAWKSEQYRHAFEQQFMEVNKNLISQPTINTKLSGSTAITALLQDDRRLLVANVGDSRCMLGRVGPHGRVSSIALNTDHTPEVASEAHRILKCKGRIGPYVFEGTNVGPKRVWLPHQDLPGLSMTRAFGDTLGATVGVVADPEMQEILLRPEDKYLVLCSDGLFEFMNNDSIMYIIHYQAQQGWPPSDIAKCLVAEANRQWMEEEDGIIDDCTVVIVFLDVSAGEPPQPRTPTPHEVVSQAASPPQAVSVARVMTDIARMNSNSLTHEELLHRTPSYPKLSIKVAP